MQTKGGCSPQHGGESLEIWPINLAGLFDFSGRVYTRWLECIMFLKSVPLDWWYWTRGQLDFEGVLWTTTLNLHMNTKWRKIWKGVRTWGSNPGPEHYQPNASPTVLFCLSVNKIINKYNKTNKHQRFFSGRDFEPDIQLMPPSHLPHCFVFLKI